jgi:integrase
MRTLDPSGFHGIISTISSVGQGQSSIGVSGKNWCHAAKRKTKVQPSQKKRAEHRAKNPKSRVREFYDSSSYRNSIEAGIKRANKTLPPDQQIPHWTPYQLRHSGVTQITLENDGNLDVARAVAGQKSIAVTQGYNHADMTISINQAKKRSKKDEE